MNATLTTSREAALAAARTIDGWLTQPEAGALYDAARFAEGPIVEIGSWQGRSTAALALGSMAGNRHPVYAIDPQIGAAETDRLSEHGIDGGPGSSSPQMLRENLDRVGVNGLVKIVPTASETAAPFVPDCGVLFVDGAHDYASVRRDLELYLPKVQPGGKVILHDVSDGDPGVVRAIDEIIMPHLDQWRPLGRVDSAVMFERAATVKHSVLLAVPGRGFDWEIVEAVTGASASHHVEITNNGNGWDDFNALWARALNRYESGHITHFAMLHSDVAPKGLWLDVLLGELDRLRADLVSVVVPIKDVRGLTSSGIGDPGDRWSPYRRFTMREAMELPPTFSIADTPHPDKFLLHNTGCWACDLSNPLFRAVDAAGNLKCFFDFPTKICRDANGQWSNWRESEDWFWSRQLADLRARTFITRKVALEHRGTAGFPNDQAWGSYRDGDDDSKHKWNPAEADEPAGLITN